MHPLPRFSFLRSLLTAGLALALAGGFSARAAAAEDVDFVRDIAPILGSVCIDCHGPDEDKGKLQLHTRELAFKRDYNIIPDDPEDSEIVYRLRLPAEDEERMPPAEEGYDALTPEQIDLFIRWMAQGAKWPEGFVVEKIEP